MKDTIDFIKLSTYGVINLNNMIPVPEDQIDEYDTNSETNINYKLLVQNEINIIRKKKFKIQKNANILYNLVKRPDRKKLRNRCCDFKLLEDKSKIYNHV